MRQHFDSTGRESSPFEWLAVTALLAYAIREPFAGAVQFYLNGLNIGFLWFAPDGIAIACIAAILVIDLTLFRSGKFLFILCTIFYYMLLGYVTIGSVASSLSGFKALLPLFVGVLLSRQVLRRRFVQATLISLLLVAIAGLWWSTYSELPWAKLNFDSGLGVKQFRPTVWAANLTYRPFGLASDEHAAGSSIVFLFALIGAGCKRDGRTTKVLT